MLGRRETGKPKPEWGGGEGNARGKKGSRESKKTEFSMVTIINEAVSVLQYGTLGHIYLVQISCTSPSLGNS